jgi:hypothetical protein
MSFGDYGSKPGSYTKMALLYQPWNYKPFKEDCAVRLVNLLRQNFTR